MTTINTTANASTSVANFNSSSFTEDQTPATFTNTLTDSAVPATSQLEGIAPASSPAASGSKLKAPAEKTIVGILVTADVVETAAGDIVLLSVQDADNKLHTVSTSPGYWAKVGRMFKEDDAVEFTAEIRKAGVTGYDRDGEFVAHTSDGMNLARIKRFSAKAFERMLLVLDEDRLVGRVEATEDSKALAVATLLGGLYGGRR